MPMVVLLMAEPPKRMAPFDDAENCVKLAPINSKLKPILVTEEDWSSWLLPINCVVPDPMLTVLPFLSNDSEPVALV